MIIVNSLAAGVRDAQNQAPQSVYGVGADLTVTGARAGPRRSGGGRFEFGQEAGDTADDATTSLSQSRLMTDMMRAALDSATLDTVADVDGVSGVSGALSLTNTSFDGELPEAPSGTDTSRADRAAFGLGRGDLPERGLSLPEWSSLRQIPSLGQARRTRLGPDGRAGCPIERRRPSLALPAWQGTSARQRMTST